MIHIVFKVGLKIEINGDKKYYILMWNIDLIEIVLQSNQQSWMVTEEVGTRAPICFLGNETESQMFAVFSSRPQQIAANQFHSILSGLQLRKR